MMYEPRAFFDRHADYWDKSMGHDPWKITAMLLLSDIAPHSVILDVGCGTGALEPYLLGFQPSVILAVDFAGNMIRLAKKKVYHEAVKFVCADIMDVTDLQADNCFIFNTFGHFPNPEQALAHITTLLRPGGRLTISHTQGKRRLDGECGLKTAMHPAQGLQKMMSQWYYVDVVADNNVMFLVSGIKR